MYKKTHKSIAGLGKRSLITFIETISHKNCWYNLITKSNYKVKFTFYKFESFFIEFIWKNNLWRKNLYDFDRQTIVYLSASNSKTLIIIKTSIYGIYLHVYLYVSEYLIQLTVQPFFIKFDFKGRF